ncbi:MAG: metallophosphoesterase [Clostridia bacterium]|nr:metallophosphoesterase [Clostridia bacterium]
MNLKFQNGEFRILVLADIHGAEKELKWTFQHIASAIEKAEPDLIVLLGDNIAGHFKGITTKKVKSTIRKIGSIFEERKFPFALVFGNHDHEGLCSLGFDERGAKKLIMKEFQSFSVCLAAEGEEMTGVGNYNLPIFNSTGEKAVFNLWFIDSNPYADEKEGGGYGYVHSDQISWYERTSEQLKKENGGENLPSFLFQHIIVPEIYEMLLPHGRKVRGSVKGHGSHSDKFYTPNPEFIKSGSVKEGPCPPDINSGQFEALVKNGNVIAAFFGHDHVNDFSASYKGIDIHQVPSAGFFSYGNNQGSCVITLYENDLLNYKTELFHCKDICEVGLHNPFIRKHGYQRWDTQIKPVVASSLAVAGAIAVLTGIKKIICR